MEEKKPFWVMGEDGAEVPVCNLPFYDDMEVVDTTGKWWTLRGSDGHYGEVVDTTVIDKKTMRAIKWHFLKTAIKFFFSR